jgi:hypothetical protein
MRWELFEIRLDDVKATFNKSVSSVEIDCATIAEFPSSSKGVFEALYSTAINSSHISTIRPRWTQWHLYALKDKESYIPGNYTSIIVHDYSPRAPPKMYHYPPPTEPTHQLLQNAAA